MLVSKSLASVAPAKVAVGSSSGMAIFKPAHQATCPPSEDKPRIWYLNPNQAPVGVWQGGNTFTDFDLDRNIGVAKSFYLRFTADFSDKDNRPACPPTFYALQRVEVYIGSDLVETVWADSLYHESLAFLIEMKAKDVADIHNVNLNDLSQRNLFYPTTASIEGYSNVSSAGKGLNNIAPDAGTIGYEEATAGATFSGNVMTAGKNGEVAPLVKNDVDGAATQTSSGYFYVNLDNTCLKAMKPYVRGLNSIIKIRVYWANSWVSQYALRSNGNATTKATFSVSNPSLAQAQLLVEEQMTDPATLAQLEQAHRAGVVDYTVMIRERLQDNPPNLVGGQNNTTFLRAFRNKSAGILFYITNQQPPNDRITQRLSFASLQLLDQRGSKLTEILDNDLLTSKIFPDQINSSFPNSANADIRTIALIPFSHHFQPTVDQGCSNGSFQMSSLEQLVLVPDGNKDTAAGEVNPNGETTSVGTNMITVVSYSYAHITVARGNHSVRFEQ
jgi:hypothetical protein